jgi:hypothetical protein
MGQTAHTQEFPRAMVWRAMRAGQWARSVPKSFFYHFSPKKSPFIIGHAERRRETHRLKLFPNQTLAASTDHVATSAGPSLGPGPGASGRASLGDFFSDEPLVEILLRLPSVNFYMQVSYAKLKHAILFLDRNLLTVLYCFLL